MSASPSRLAHLDGLRGVAILLVLAGHSVHKIGGAPGPVEALLNSDLGVLIFFVLSGYLITHILLSEAERTGTVNLQRFYIRRTLRIFPAFYIMLGVTLTLAAVTGTVALRPAEVVFSSLFLVNYSPVPISWWLGHIWSLAIEEQFYLIWPALMIALRPKRALSVALAFIAIAPFLRIGSYILIPSARDRIPVFLHTRADALIVGSALALVASHHPDLFAKMTAWVQRYRLSVVALLTLIVSSFMQHYFSGEYMLPLGYSANAVAVATLLVASTSDGATRRILSFKPLVAVGVISYSLYLWQQLFLASEWKSGLMASVPACLAFSFAAAIASRLLVENPALRLKSRFETPTDVPPGGDPTMNPTDHTGVEAAEIWPKHRTRPEVNSEERPVRPRWRR